jgi:hypothetical protein
MDTSVANAVIGVFAFGFFLMSVPLIIDGSVVKLAVLLGILTGVLGPIWVGFARGTYITVANGKVCGNLFFAPGKKTPIADVVEIKQRTIFGGLMAEVYMTYRAKSGTLLERGLVSKQGLKKSELKNLLELIRSTNPSIDIAPELLK